MSGRATADKINWDLRIAKGSKLWRIACSTFLGFLTVAGLFVAVAPLPGRADDDKDRHRGHEDNDKGVRAEIAALQAQVESLQAAVSALQGQVSSLEKANTDQQNEINSLQTSNAKLQNQVNSLQTSNTTLQNQLANAKNVLALDPFVSVDPNPEIGVIGPNIIFSGANIHIVSGSGMTDEGSNPRGLGNLIIGYDEDPVHYFAGGPGGGIPLSPGDRSGSHNLVIGVGNRFTQSAFGGIVAGELNTISSFGATVAGGRLNTASGSLASVSGGIKNTASGNAASVSGGGANTAAGGEGASVSGGELNTASGSEAAVTGGFGNTAGGFATVVIGGSSITDNNNFSIAPQPPFP